MPVYRDKKRGCFVFEFDRRINKKRVRVRKHLPKTWSQAQADKFDRQESERLYGVATGVIRSQHTINEAVEVYLQDKGHLKSLKETAIHLGQVQWAFNNKPIDQLPEVANLIRKRDTHLAAATLKNRISLLRAACRWAWKKHNMCDADPAARLQVPEVKNERHVYIEIADLHRMLRHIPNREVRMVMVAGFYTGMRLSEILRSKRQGDALVVMDTKNGTAIKSIPLHPTLKRYLKTWPVSCAKSTVQKWQRIARKATKLDHVHFHDLRHSTASALINSGADLYMVGQVLGHKDPRSTQRYAHLKHDTMQRALDKIGQKVA